ncbi:MAG: exo-alpha-sialidase [Planctomycetes bacterium]|nr:exo-alpha-sialidase [Planctomycetota bacterium]
MARTSTDGQTWSEPRRILSGFFIEGPRQLPSGRLLLSGEHVGSERETKRMKLLYTDQRDGLGGWKEARIEIEKLSVFNYTEPSFFSRDNGTLVMSFRNRSGFLYASVSSDQGQSWSIPSRTNLRDCRSRFSAGNLPDGTAFLINNPGPHHRRYLTIVLSDDGKTFDRAFMIFGKRIRHRYGGRTKSLDWQYPNAIVWKNHLHVAYSINKEDLGASRIALEDLKR